MSAHRSRLLWIGVPGMDPEDSTGLPAPGGVVLFGRNLDPDPAIGPARCHALIAGLQAVWGRQRPMVVALDQEGGAVSRLRPWVGCTPNLRKIWSTRGAAGCAAWGRLWGEGLGRLGFNVDLAPVADLYDEAGGAAMGDRCADPEPYPTAQAAGAFLHGLESEGLRGCLKHFPGLGGAIVDSHRDLPRRGEGENLDRHREPFRMLAHADRFVMVAHLHTPASGGLPASLDRGHAAGNPWGIAARWVTDDLEMGACARWSWGERVKLALGAGHEALLVCQTGEAIAAAAEALERLPEQPAMARPLALRPGPAAFDRAGWEDWVARVRAVAEA